MEQQPNHHIHVNSCHQVIFKQLDELKATVSELQKSTQSPGPKIAGCGSPTHCMHRGSHTMSVPTFRKVTEVENWIVPGSVKYQYHNRHHLDDTQMKEALHWDLSGTDDYETVKHYDAQRQSYKHQKTEPSPTNYKLEERAIARQQRARNEDRRNKQKVVTPRSRKLPTEPAGKLADKNTKPIVTQFTSSVETKDPRRDQIEMGRGQKQGVEYSSEDNHRRKQQTNHIRLSESPHSNQHTPNHREQYNTNPIDNRVGEDNAVYHRQTFGHTEQTRYRKKQNQYKPSEKYTIDMRNNEQKGYAEDNAYRTESTRHNQYNTGGNRMNQYSSSHANSQRKDGYLLIRRRRVKHIYEQLSVSSDSYFSPYEDEL